MEKEKSIFDHLSKINVNDKTEKKNNLTYLSWAWAWGIVKKEYPTATYEVKEYEGKPYLFDQHLGYLVSTVVTIDGESLPMSLPVMDGANKAQKHEAYKYSTKYGEKDVQPATMFDINTAIMRCLTKNLAMFGLGHYIYAGEDLPQVAEEKSKEQKAEVFEKLKTVDSFESLLSVAKEYQQLITKDAEIMAEYAKLKKKYPRK